MSRAIQIRVAESVARVVHVDDGVQAPLELLPILALDRMAELLAAELAARGFERDGDLARRADPDGVIVEVDLRAATVTARIAATHAIDETADRTQTVDSDHRAAAEDQLRDTLRRELDDRVATRAEALRAAATARLERRLGDLRAELDAAVGRATVEALKQRAASLGDVESVVEDAAGNVTIKVRL